MITSPSIIEIHYSLPMVAVNRNPRWLRLIKNYLPDKKKIRVGLLNIAENERESYEATGTSILENVHVLLDPLPKNLTWESLFPVWIDEDHTWNAPVCPEVPLPQVEGTAADVDVVVVKMPCVGFSESKGLRDVFRLQVNLAAAKLVVESGRRNVDPTVYVVFIGSCEPMHEIFRCDERVRRVGEYWVLEPSACLFEELMQQSFKIKSYNGGDQGFLNEYFVWWHRLSKRVNTMKYFGEETNIGPKRNLPDNLEGIHYLGIKPWRCYRDYDCNWDLTTRRVYASESVNKKWWKVYDKMPKKLQRYCGLTRKMDKNIEKWMKAAKVKGFPEKHWGLQVGDPRKKNLVG
ncbi:hypothetical protein F2Q70_00039830 [Brassica cretica]|uniref:Hexosyltransferase n=1 Tax=Brassica cretica TaxID=69181 RepID=A0A8S9K4H9_BRACR|nr:hypothetical protein F2Q70_00039830 [Brassica cretica]